MPAELSPHQNTVFSLIPLNNLTTKWFIDEPKNRHLVTTLWGSFRVLSIRPGLSKCSLTLATIGRDSNKEIYSSHNNVGRTQCSFEINPRTGAVVLYDLSADHEDGGTKIICERTSRTTPFEGGGGRKVVVKPGLNTAFGLGGVYRNLFKFRIHWHQYPIPEVYYKNVILPDVLLPPSRVPTGEKLISKKSPHPVDKKPRMRYEVLVGEAIQGPLAEVSKVVDLRTGDVVVIKTLKRSNNSPESDPREDALKREIDAISSAKDNNHIVDIITAQGWNESQIEIFMGLKDGSLQELIRNQCPVNRLTAFHHMLQGLDFLRFNGIVHRGIKPEHILYMSLPDGTHHFQLGGFGINDHVVDRDNFVGSLHYAAPETLNHGEQSHKSDVWSLFVTILWVVEHGKIEQVTRNSEQVLDLVFYASHLDDFSVAREMVHQTPEERASSKDMLVKIFNGDGVCTGGQSSNTVDDEAGLEELSCRLNAIGESVPVSDPMSLCGSS